MLREHFIGDARPGFGGDGACDEHSEVLQRFDALGQVVFHFQGLRGVSDTLTGTRPAGLSNRAGGEAAGAPSRRRAKLARDPSGLAPVALCAAHQGLSGFGIAHGAGAQGADGLDVLALPLGEHLDLRSHLQPSRFCEGENVRLAAKVVSRKSLGGVR